MDFRFRITIIPLLAFAVLTPLAAIDKNGVAPARSDLESSSGGFEKELKAPLENIDRKD